MCHNDITCIGDTGWWQSHCLMTCAYVHKALSLLVGINGSVVLCLVVFSLTSIQALLPCALFWTHSHINVRYFGYLVMTMQDHKQTNTHIHITTTNPKRTVIFFVFQAIMCTFLQVWPTENCTCLRPVHVRWGGKQVRGLYQQCLSW